MKKPWYLIVTLLVISAMALALVAGCGGGDKKPAAEAPKAGGPQGTIMIYTSIYPDIIELIKPALKKQFPNLEVQWFQAGTEKVMAKIAGEIEAKKIQADLIMVADPSYYLTLKNQGLLLKYESPNRKDVKINKDADGYWTGVRISNMIIAYNPEKTPAPPKTWKDLLDPKWRGKIAMPSPLLSGTAYVAAGELSDKYGWKYFEDLKANGLKVEEGNSAIQNKLLRGEYAAVMILEENILKMASKGEPVKVMYPEDGTIVVPSPIAIFNTSKNQEAAKAVLDYFLSKEGQEVIVKGWMHSVRDDVQPPKGAPPLKTFIDKAIKPNWERLAKDNEKVKEIFRSKVLEKK